MIERVQVFVLPSDGVALMSRGKRDEKKGRSCLGEDLFVCS